MMDEAMAQAATRLVRRVQKMLGPVRDERDAKVRAVAFEALVSLSSYAKPVPPPAAD